MGHLMFRLLGWAPLCDFLVSHGWVVHRRWDRDEGWSGRIYRQRHLSYLDRSPGFYDDPNAEGER